MSPESSLANINADLVLTRLDAERKRQHAGLGELQKASETGIRQIDQHKVVVVQYNADRSQRIATLVRLVINLNAKCSVRRTGAGNKSAHFANDAIGRTQPIENDPSPLVCPQRRFLIPAIACRQGNLVDRIKARAIQTKSSAITFVVDEDVFPVGIDAVESVGHGFPATANEICAAVSVAVANDHDLNRLVTLDHAILDNERRHGHRMNDAIGILAGSMDLIAVGKLIQ